jgi:hypothetical protein
MGIADAARARHAIEPLQAAEAAGQVGVARFDDRGRLDSAHVREPPLQRSRDRRSRPACAASDCG